MRVVPRLPLAGRHLWAVEDAKRVGERLGVEVDAQLARQGMCLAIWRGVRASVVPDRWLCTCCDSHPMAQRCPYLQRLRMMRSISERASSCGRRSLVASERM